MEKGKIINQYRIISPIGKGGMGEVLLAQDTKLDRKVALKILPPEFAEDKDRMNRFVREARSASGLNHPNIITIHEIGESNGTHFIATEFIDGKTLNEYKQASPLNYKSALDIAIQVASGLDEAHQAGIVHRDIKPDNVMIRSNGLVKILDFGIAKTISDGGLRNADLNNENKTLIQPNNPKSPIRNPQSTMPGIIIGTANFMSPEQAEGKQVDARTDIFSFGVLLYEMIAGDLPFEGDSAMKMIGAILHKEPKPLDSEVPPEITKIINKCLRKNRDERYQTIKDVGNDLKDVRQELELKNLIGRNLSVPSAVADGFTQAPQSVGETESIASIIPETNPQPSATADATGKPRNPRFIAAGLLTILLAIGGFFGYKYLSPTKQIESIAVMPFVNESKNEEVEYLSDGMTETLINSLSQIPNLSVKARSTVFYYKGKEISPQKIGEELKVQAILNGRVVRRGNDLILYLSLVDVKTGDQIWGETYNRSQSDLVTLQTDIARDVSSKLKSKLSKAESARIEKTYTTNAEAYQLYLQGRFHWNKRTGADFQQAVVFFKKAIEKDPNYALAFAGLADTYALFPDWVNGKPKEYMPQAKQAALKALELDPNLGEAHASLALVKFFYDYDWAGAEQSFKRSFELNPKYPTARQWYGTSLIWAGRRDEGLMENLRAAELDPFSKIIIWNLGDAFQYNGKYDEAIRQYQKIIELFSDQRVNADIGDTYAAQGRYQQAVEAYMNGYRFDKEIKPEEIQKLKASYDQGGWESFGRAKQEIDLNSLQARQAKDPDRYIRPYYIARAYCWGKDKEKVLEYLNKAYEDRSADILRQSVEFPFAFIRDDPRYKELVRKVGIPE